MNNFPKFFAAALIAVAMTGAGCSGGSLSTREKGAGIGTLGGAAAGGIIGAAVGHAGAGAAIGGALGLGTGALIGDQLQGQEIKQAEQQKAIDQQRAEIAKNQALIDELKKLPGIGGKSAQRLMALEPFRSATPR